jgi:hypothetical protein
MGIRCESQALGLPAATPNHAIRVDPANHLPSLIALSPVQLPTKGMIVRMPAGSRYFLSDLTAHGAQERGRNPNAH